MKNYKQAIDRCNEANTLREVLGELADEIDALDNMPYEEASHLNRIHDLELLLRYGEQKLAKLLA